MDGYIVVLGRSVHSFVTDTEAVEYAARMVRAGARLIRFERPVAGFSDEMRKAHNMVD